MRYNSWIVVSRVTNEPVLETWLPTVVKAINQDRYEVLTALEWLQKFNQQVKARE